MNLAIQAIFAGITDPELLHSINQLEQGNTSLLKSTEDKSFPVQDTEGNLLVVGDRYLFNNKIVRIEDYKFGSGNPMDTYYYVSYLDDSLTTKRVTIEGKYPSGIFNGAVYKSNFSLLNK